MFSIVMAVDTNKILDLLFVSIIITIKNDDTENNNCVSTDKTNSTIIDLDEAFKFIVHRHIDNVDL